MSKVVMEATPMKLAGILGTAVLSLTLGAAVPVFAQEEHGQQEEHAQQEGKKVQQEKPAQQEEKHAQQEEKKAQQEKPGQQEEKHAQQEEKKSEQQKPVAQHEQQAERASGNHGRIPDDRFRANFGREHVFVINRPVVIEGQPRFQYGGYWFGFSQPWPLGWAYSDNVYVDYVDGGYYLYNPFHPGIRIIIIVI
jgi:hypothetical protein